MAFSLTEDREKHLQNVLSRYPTKRAASLPLLHLCQEQHGWINNDIVEFVAKRLELSTSEIKGVVTFYTLFHQQKVAPKVIWVCRTLSCELRGAKAIQSHLETRLGCKVGGTSKDGNFTLLKAECLAACGQAPMIQINDTYYENLDCSQVDKIIEEQVAPAGN